MTSMDKTEDVRATVDQMSTARAACGNNPFLLGELEAFLSTKPSRSEMSAFIEGLRDPKRQKERFDASILGVCKLLGIEQPTAAERLLALQVGLLQEQNAALSMMATRLGAQHARSQSGQTQSVFTPFLTGMLVGELIAR